MNTSGPVSQPTRLLVFTLDEQSYALRLPVVERVTHAVAVTHLPGKPEVVLGIISVHGRIVPVVDIRGRFCLPSREMQLSDQLIVARTPRRLLALPVDSTAGVVEFSEQDLVEAEQIIPNLGYVEGAVRTGDGMVLIHDLDKFLCLEEEKALEASLDARAR